MRYCILLILLLISAPALAAAPAAESCLPSDAICILTQAVDGIDPDAVKTVQDENLAFGAAASVVLLGNDKLRQDMLDKIKKIRDSISAPTYIPGTSPDREKSFAEMMLMAALGHGQDVANIIGLLKNSSETFEKGLEPQLRVVDRLTVIGKLDDAKALMKATRNMDFSSEGFKGEWAGPYGPPALLLIKAYLNEGRLQDAQDVAALLNPPNIFSRGVSDDAVKALFARYKAPKDAKPAPQTPPPASAGKYPERDKLLQLIKDGKTDQAQAELNRHPENRRVALNNIMRIFADSTSKPAMYDETFRFYMEGCQALYPQLKASRSRCLLMLLVDAAAKKETAISREFNAKYPAACAKPGPDGACP